MLVSARSASSQIPSPQRLAASDGLGAEAGVSVGEGVLPPQADPTLASSNPGPSDPHNLRERGTFAPPKSVLQTSDQAR